MMTKKNSTKRALTSSVLSLVLCIAMLIGSTFAWFTDIAASKNNKIVAGTLDVQLLMHDGTKYADISDTEASIFGASDSVIAQNKNTDTLWEPGKTQVAYLAIRNKGNLDLKYQVTLAVRNPEGGKELYKAMQYVITPDAQNGEITAWDGTNAQTVALGTQTVSNGEGYLSDGETHYFALSVHMMEDAGNEYQGGEIDFDLSVVAAQLVSEEDSFGPEYDNGAEYPVWLGETDTEWDGSGTKDDPYVLGSVDELAGLAQAVNGTTKARAAANDYKNQYFKLTADVDLENRNWTPIGGSATPFKGHFDGGNHTVSNLLIESEASYIGLFGYTKEGSVANLTVNNAKIVGRLGVGVISGCPYTSDFSNITLTGDIKIDAAFYVGGVVGRNAYGDLTDITVNANEGSYVKANSVEDGTAYRTYVGGVVGFMGEGNHTVKNVTSNIDVIGSTIDVGGIAGIAHYGNSFINCSSSGDVTLTDLGDEGDNLEIGGIAGVWHNGGSPVTFTGCSYTGTLSSPNVTTFPYNGLVGKAYNATGNGVLDIDGKKYKNVEISKITELDKAIKDGATVIDAKGANLGDFYYGAKFTDGVTIKNAKFTYFYGGNVEGTVTFENCEFVSDHSYSANFDSGNGNIIFNNCLFDGWSSFGTAIKNVEMNNCTFNKTYNYGIVRFYQNAQLNNCTFADNFEGVDTNQTGTEVHLNNCTGIENKIFNNGDKVGIWYVDGVKLTDVPTW